MGLAMRLASAARMTAAPDRPPFHADVADAPDGRRRPLADDRRTGLRLRAVDLARAASAAPRVIFPGRTEFAEKYGRVAGRLAALGLAVAVIDWRGQGLSARPPRTPMRGHIDDFRDYQRDVAALLDLVEALGMPGPRYLVAHSMGGCIGLRTLLERAGFRDRDLLGADVEPADEGGDPRAHRPLHPARPHDGLRHAADARHPREADRARGRLREQRAHQRPRYLRLVREPDRRPSRALARRPVACSGPAPRSRRWHGSTSRRCRTCPSSRFLGTDETVVSTSVIRTQISQMPQARLVEIPGARHEIFMERPEILDLVWREVGSFLAAPHRRGLAATG